MAFGGGSPGSCICTGCSNPVVRFWRRAASRRRALETKSMTLLPDAQVFFPGQGIIRPCVSWQELERIAGMMRRFIDSMRKRMKRNKGRWDSRKLLCEQEQHSVQGAASAVRAFHYACRDSRPKSFRSCLGEASTRQSHALISQQVGLKLSNSTLRCRICGFADNDWQDTDPQAGRVALSICVNLLRSCELFRRVVHKQLVCGTIECRLQFKIHPCHTNVGLGRMFEFPSSLVMREIETQSFHQA